MATGSLAPAVGPEYVVRGSVPKPQIPRRRVSKRPPKSKVCVEPGCGRPVRANERCAKHYDNPTRCRICGKAAKARELCVSHYTLWRKGKPLTSADTTRLVPRCAVPGCGLEVHAKGLCGRHYAEYQRQDTERHAQRLAHQRERRRERKQQARPDVRPAVSPLLRRVINESRCPECQARRGYPCHDEGGRIVEIHEERVGGFLDSHRIP